MLETPTGLLCYCLCTREVETRPVPRAAEGCSLSAGSESSRVSSAQEGRLWASVHRILEEFCPAPSPSLLPHCFTPPPRTWTSCWRGQSYLSCRDTPAAVLQRLIRAPAQPDAPTRRHLLLVPRTPPPAGDGGGTGSVTCACAESLRVPGPGLHFPGGSCESRFMCVISAAAALTRLCGVGGGRDREG